MRKWGEGGTQSEVVPNGEAPTADCRTWVEWGERGM